jgi:hypothetical protein
MTMTYGDKFFFAIVSVLVAAGCPASDDGGADTGAATEATAGTTGGSTPTTMSTSGTTPGDDAVSAADSDDDVVDDTADTMPPATSDPTTGDASTGDATGDASTGDASTGDASTGGNNAGPCEPDPLDDECATCVKTNCCTQLEACGMDVGCTCFQDCVEKNPGVAGAIACGGECDVMIFGEGATADLVGCSSAPPCAAPCGV